MEVSWRFLTTVTSYETLSLTTHGRARLEKSVGDRQVLDRTCTQLVQGAPCSNGVALEDASGVAPCQKVGGLCVVRRNRIQGEIWLGLAYLLGGIGQHRQRSDPQQVQFWEANSLTAFMVELCRQEPLGCHLYRYKIRKRARRDDHTSCVDGQVVRYACDATGGSHDPTGLLIGERRDEVIPGRAIGVGMMAGYDAEYGLELALFQPIGFRCLAYRSSAP